MKAFQTKVRIQKSVSHIPSGQIEVAHITFLVPRYKHSKYLTVGGWLKLQRNMGEDRWYGAQWHVETDRVSDMEYMVKVMKHAQTYPEKFNLVLEDLLAHLGAQEYIYYQSEFRPKDILGKSMYHICTGPTGNSVYCDFVATNLAEACKAYKKFVKAERLNDSVLKFNHKITEESIQLNAR